MADLFVRIGRFARSPILVGGGALPDLSRAVAAEALHLVANTVTRAWQGSGVITFAASAGHATVTGYAARLYTYPADAFVASSSLGVPTPDGNGLIQADLTTFFGAQAAGDYTLRIRATDAGGSTDSPPSSPFTLPVA